MFSHLPAITVKDGCEGSVHQKHFFGPEISFHNLKGINAIKSPAAVIYPGQFALADEAGHDL